MSRAAMEQALEALRAVLNDDYNLPYKKIIAASDALQAALAEQPAPQEPVAWAEQIIDDLTALHDTEMIQEIDSGDALIRLDDAIAAVEEARDRYTTPPAPQPLTEREVELLDGMIEVQLHHAAQCDQMRARAGGNHTMAERQKGWDMERVELLRKIRRMGVRDE